MDQVGSTSFVYFCHLHADSCFECCSLEHHPQILANFKEAVFLDDDHHQVEDSKDKEQNGESVTLLYQRLFFCWVNCSFKFHADVDKRGKDDREGGENGPEQNGGEDAEDVVNFVLFIDMQQFEEIGPLELMFDLILLRVRLVLTVIRPLSRQSLNCGVAFHLLLFTYFLLNLLNALHDCYQLVSGDPLNFAFVDLEDVVGFLKGLHSMGNHDNKGNVRSVFQVGQDIFLVDAVQS